MNSRLMRESKEGLLFLFLIIISLEAYTQDQDLPAHFEDFAHKYPQSVFWKGSDDTRSLALTFDDGPTAATPAILDLLDKHDVKATFFWQGNHLIQYPEMVSRAIAAGHEFGNHSWNHPDCSGLSIKEMWQDQFLPTSRVYDSLFNLSINLYRPPYGGVSETQLDHFKSKQIMTIMWSISSMDWDPERNSSSEMIQRFEKGLHPGAIVLLHDQDFDNSLQEKLTAIEGIIQIAKRKNYAFSTISELLNQP